MHSFFRTFFFTFILFSTKVSSCLYAHQKLEGIAAIVGNEIILESEIQEGLFSNSTRKKIYPEDRCRFFEKMLINQLLLYYAKKNPTLKLNDQQLQLQVEKIIKDFEKQAGSKKIFLKAYGRKTMNEIRQEIMTIVKNRQYIQQQYEEVIEGVDATPEQVRKFYEKNKDNLPELPEEVELGEIVFSPCVTQKHREKIINRLEKIKQDVLQGESFATKAIAYSEDPASAVRGGLIKGIQRGQMVEEFEKVAFSMQEGEISKPFETKFGFHLLQLQNRRGEKVDVRHILIRPQYTDAEIETVRALANSVSTLLAEKKMSFNEAFKKYSSEKTNQGRVKNIETGDNRFEKKRLPINMFVHIAGLQKGSITQSYEEERDGHKVYVILKLLKDIPAHKISFLEDYQQLKGITENFKKEEKLRSWIHKRIDEVFIKVGKDYKNCLFEYNWLKT